MAIHLAGYHAMSCCASRQLTELPTQQSSNKQWPSVEYVNMYQTTIVKLIGNRMLGVEPADQRGVWPPEVAKTSLHRDCRKIKPCSVVGQRRTLSCAAADKLSNCRPHLRQRCSTAVNSLQNGGARLRTFSSTLTLRKTQYFCTVSRYQQLFGLT